MNFAIALVNDETMNVAAVMRSDAPFGGDSGMGFHAAGHHTVYVGAFADEVAPDGKPWAEWLRTSLTILAGDIVEIAAGGPRLLDKACTIEAIADASRSGRRIHAHIEAWLRAVLSAEACNAMGLRRGIPAGVLRGLHRIRARRVGHEAAFEQAAKRKGN